MDNFIEPDDMLMRYLDNEMNQDERIAFEDDISKNQQLRSHLEGLQSARNAVILYSIKQQVETIATERKKTVREEIPVIKMKPYRSKLKYGFIAVAAVLLIFVGINRYNNYNLTAASLYAEQYISFEPSNSRGDTLGITMLEKAYQQKKYNEVISIYKTTLSPSLKQMIIAGSAYLETGDSPDAIKTFSSLLAKNKTDNTTAFNDDAAYYLALAYLKNKDYTQAIELMESIHADDGNIYSKKFDQAYISRVKKLRSK